MQHSHVTLAQTLPRPYAVTPAHKCSSMLINCDVLLNTTKGSYLCLLGVADNVLDRYSPRTQEPNTKIPAMHDRVKYTNASLKTIVKILLQIYKGV